MKPVLFCHTDDQPVLLSLISCLSNIECTKHFSMHLGKSQAEQKAIVGDFQRTTKSALEQTVPSISWSAEHLPGHQNRDSIDIFGQGDDFVVAIELDKFRADQVAKKFVSRMAILPAANTYFISLCYPGTEKMSKSECEKYFGYCKNLANRMGNHYAGFIIQ